MKERLCQYSRRKCEQKLRSLSATSHKSIAGFSPPLSLSRRHPRICTSLSRRPGSQQRADQGTCLDASRVSAFTTNIRIWNREINLVVLRRLASRRQQVITVVFLQRAANFASERYCRSPEEVEINCLRLYRTKHNPFFRQAGSHFRDSRTICTCSREEP